MYIDKYNREKAVEYAHKWAYLRNNEYYNYDKIGGDCTNFISQCIYAGSQKMNYKKDTGWYYANTNNKAPAWTGVEFLHKFLIDNKGMGPFGIEKNIHNLELGDIIQLSFDNVVFAHSLIIVENKKNILIATHTFDADYKDVENYTYQKIRGIHIEGVRK